MCDNVSMRDSVDILGQTAPTKVKFLKLTFWFARVWNEFGLVRSVRNDNKSQGKAGLAPRVILDLVFMYKTHHSKCKDFLYWVGEFETTTNHRARPASPRG